MTSMYDYSGILTTLQAGWFTRNHGDLCWELDAMDPQRPAWLRRIEDSRADRARRWERCEVVNEAETESLKTILARWATATE